MWRREVIGPPECPLVHRWTLAWAGKRFGSRLPKLVLHRFLPDREDQDVHDHPRGFVTFVLRGGYDDLVECSRCCGAGAVAVDPGEHRMGATTCDGCCGRGVVVGDSLRAGEWRRRSARYSHMTRTGQHGAWTLCLMFAVERDWGFWREGRWWPFGEYERRFGMAMRCGDEPVVRYGWDGTGAGNGGGVFVKKPPVGLSLRVEEWDDLLGPSS